MVDSLTLLGLVAATLTTGSFVPQVIKVYKTKSAKDLSWTWLAGFFFGILLWFIYGNLISSLPLIMANGITLVLGITIIGLKYKYEKK